MLSTDFATTKTELCGHMGYLTGISGIGKAQIPYLIEANMRSFCDHDEMEYKKLADKERLSALRREREPFYYVEGKIFYSFFKKIFPFYISRGEEGVE